MALIRQDDGMRRRVVLADYRLEDALELPVLHARRGPVDLGRHERLVGVLEWAPGLAPVDLFDVAQRVLVDVQHVKLAALYVLAVVVLARRLLFAAPFLAARFIARFGEHMLATWPVVFHCLTTGHGLPI